MKMSNARCQCAFTPRCLQIRMRLSWCYKQNLDSCEISRLAIRVPRFVVDHTIEDVPVCDAASRVDAAMVS
ncbi:hypothetical protein TNCV_1738021 [Trichonephila clavipes]|nr:hypothetical protein TNCV_1738021 [Trichonephila clavipes]